MSLSFNFHVKFIFSRPFMEEISFFPWLNLATSFMLARQNSTVRQRKLTCHKVFHVKITTHHGRSCHASTCGTTAWFCHARWTDTIKMLKIKKWGYFKNKKKTFLRGLPFSSTRLLQEGAYRILLETCPVTLNTYNLLPSLLAVVLTS
jgi:hypothetical protein